MSIKEIIKELKMLLKKAKINNNLKKAIEETIKALNKNDIDLAYEITAVKSFVSGDMKSKKHHFREDSDYNNSIFGGCDVYSILDDIHHKLAWQADKMPSGMMILTPYGMREKEKAKKKHTIIAMMEKEQAEIYAGKF